MSKKLFLLACACCTLLQAKELVITSRVEIDDKAEAALLEELSADSRELTRKYSDADGVHSVETTVQVTRCEVCGIGGREESRCNCGKPRPKCEECGNIAGDQDNIDQDNIDEEEITKCNCGKPRPRCACGKPRPRCEECASATAHQHEDAAECTECQDHTQAEEKIAQDENGEEICSDCSETLRSCKSCCKKKCCKKCKKCCKKCSSCTTSSTCTSCCS